MVMWNGDSDQGWSSPNNSVRYHEFMETARYGYFKLFEEVVICSYFGLKTKYQPCNEIMAHIDAGDGRYELFHYRDREKREIDFLIERKDDTLIGIEIKAGSAVAKRDFYHLRWFQRILKKTFIHRYNSLYRRTSCLFGRQLVGGTFQSFVVLVHILKTV